MTSPFADHENIEVGEPLDSQGFEIYSISKALTFHFQALTYTIGLFEFYKFQT